MNLDRWVARRLIRQPCRLTFQVPAWENPSYGFGFLGDVQSRFGSILGHNGGGPGYSTSSFCVEREDGLRLFVSVVINNDFGPQAESMALALIGCAAMTE